MPIRALLLLVLLSLAACAGGGRVVTGGGASSSLECAPYARQASGIMLYGDAADWWDAADGRYGKGEQPVAGGVLVFQRSGRLPSGHVSVVRSVVSAREIRVDQANWVHHRITQDESVIDVSDANDWSRVRVWWDPAGAMGAWTYETFGFIAP